MSEPIHPTTEKQSIRPAEELLYHLQYATREAETMLRGGIVEVAVRNHRVAEYCAHWEGRALKAEAHVERLKAALNEAEAVMRGEHGADWSEHFGPLFNLIEAARS